MTAPDRTSMSNIDFPPGSRLEAITRDRPTLVVFLRHFG